MLLQTVRTCSHKQYCSTLMLTVNVKSTFCELLSVAVISIDIMFVFGLVNIIMSMQSFVLYVFAGISVVALYHAYIVQMYIDMLSVRSFVIVPVK